MWLLTLILFFLKHSLTQITPLYLRKTTISNKYMHTISLCYYRIANADYYSSWTTAMTTYYWTDRTKYNLRYYYTTSLNSITSGASTAGFELGVRQTYIYDTNITFQILGAANKQADPAVWFTVRIFVFLLPSDVPFSMGQINKNIYSNSVTNLSITMQFFPNPTFAQYCFYDSAKTIKDKIYLLPSLYQLRGSNP